jgi:hypothetical protein
MKFTICILTILAPGLCWAQLAGNWAGVVKDSQGAHRIALHISGPFNAMQASASITDQKLTDTPVESITFADSTLEFSIPASDARFSGVLNDSGAIAGTFTQHGMGMPLVLARVAAVPALAPDIPSQGSVAVANGHYVHKPSGVEFDLPSRWSIDRTQFSNGSPSESIIIDDPSGKATVISLNIGKVNVDPENISKSLPSALAHLVAMRAGDGPPRQAAPNYKIREGSVQQTYIRGHQALRAIGEFNRGGANFAEFVAWIFTEHTRTYFFLRASAEDLAGEEAPFDEWLQSAKIP